MSSATCATGRPGNCVIPWGRRRQRRDPQGQFWGVHGGSIAVHTSGHRQYRRLNRGGDRQANAALRRIVFTRLRVDPRTQDYYERRITEGKTGAESSVASNATLPGRSSTWLDSYSQTPAQRVCRDR
ncbi:transposase [Streptomyces sp. NPDC058470]|uniref:transposase n=1 Tax=Streptomyces sp. NPDC058470 TaxID=3346515 RepID=UPI0036476B6A